MKAAVVVVAVAAVNMTQEVMKLPRHTAHRTGQNMNSSITQMG